MKDAVERVFSVLLRGCGVVAVLLVASGLEAAAASEPPTVEDWQVIANLDVDGGAVSRATLANIFLGKAGRWGSGGRVIPIDQSARSEVREAFARAVLGRSLSEVLSYWRGQILRGIRPPKVKASDQEVVEYVAANPGAVGYVSAKTSLEGAPVKVLAVTD